MLSNVRSLYRYSETPGILVSGTKDTQKSCDTLMADSNNLFLTSALLEHGSYPQNTQSVPRMLAVFWCSRAVRLHYRRLHSDIQTSTTKRSNEERLWISASEQEWKKAYIIGCQSGESVLCSLDSFYTLLAANYLHHNCRYCAESTWHHPWCFAYCLVVLRSG